MLRKAKAPRTRANEPVNPDLPAPYSRMTADELEQEIRKFDDEFIAERSRSLTPAEARRDAIVRRGRPRAGLGAEKIRISVERGLLKRADAAAKALRTSRSGLIALGLRLLTSHPDLKTRRGKPKRAQTQEVKRS